jgi:hypothetical protein
MPTASLICRQLAAAAPPQPPQASLAPGAAPLLTAAERAAAVEATLEMDIEVTLWIPDSLQVLFSWSRALFQTSFSLLGWHQCNCDRTQLRMLLVLLYSIGPGSNVQICTKLVLGSMVADASGDCSSYPYCRTHMLCSITEVCKTCAQVRTPPGREMPADAQHELARRGIAVVGRAAPNLVAFPLLDSNPLAPPEAHVVTCSV